MHDVPGARAAAEELTTLATATRAPFLRALAAQSIGEVLLADDDARGALPVLREAWMTWQELDAPYHAARVRVQLGLACRALGDEEGAALELDAARATYEHLRIEGKVGFRFADREEVFEAGDAYYVPPGHTPVHFAGAEIVEFSPTDVLSQTIPVVLGNLRAAGAAVEAGR